MSTANIEDYFINLLSVTLPAVTILPAIYGSEIIKTLGRKYMLLESLRSVNSNLDELFNKIVYQLNYKFIAESVLAITSIAFISLFIINLGSDIYEIAADTTYLIYALILLASICSYWSIMPTRINPTAMILEEKLVKFNRRWKLLATLWIIVTAFYVIPVVNLEGYNGFLFNYETQSFILIWIPLSVILLSMILFFYSGLMSKKLTRELVNKKLSEKSISLEINAYVRSIDGKLETIHGFVVHLGKYVKMETEMTFEILKYADIRRISSIKERNDPKCE